MFFLNVLSICRIMFYFEGNGNNFWIEMSRQLGHCNYFSWIADIFLPKMKGKSWQKIFWFKKIFSSAFIMPSPYYWLITFIEYIMAACGKLHTIYMYIYSSEEVQDFFSKFYVSFLQFILMTAYSEKRVSLVKLLFLFLPPTIDFGRSARYSRKKNCSGLRWYWWHTYVAEYSNRP
jgi:hypothetical protein